MFCVIIHQRLLSVREHEAWNGYFARGERLKMHASLQKKKKQTSDSIGEDEMMIILDSKSLYIKPPRTFFHPLITFCAIFAKVNKPITVWSVWVWVRECMLAHPIIILSWQPLLDKYSYNSQYCCEEQFKVVKKQKNFLKQIFTSMINVW